MPRLISNIHLVFDTKVISKSMTEVIGLSCASLGHLSHLYTRIQSNASQFRIHEGIAITPHCS